MNIDQTNIHQFSFITFSLSTRMRYILVHKFCVIVIYEQVYTAGHMNVSLLVAFILRGAESVHCTSFWFSYITQSFHLIKIISIVLVLTMLTVDHPLQKTKNIFIKIELIYILVNILKTKKGFNKLIMRRSKCLAV